MLSQIASFQSQYTPIKSQELQNAHTYNFHYHFSYMAASSVDGESAWLDFSLFHQLWLSVVAILNHPTQACFGLELGLR